MAFSYGVLHLRWPSGENKHTSSSVQTLDAFGTACHKRWTIVMHGERVSGNAVLLLSLDDDDDDDDDDCVCIDRLYSCPMTRVTHTILFTATRVTQVIAIY